MAGRRANNEGSITKRADGRWVARVTLEGGRRKYFYAKTRQEAAKRLTAALRDRDVGLPIVGERQTFGQYLASWLTAVEHSVKPRSHQSYQRMWREDPAVHPRGGSAARRQALPTPGHQPTRCAILAPLPQGLRESTRVEVASGHDMTLYDAPSSLGERWSAQESPGVSRGEWSSERHTALRARGHQQGGILTLRRGESPTGSRFSDAGSPTPPRRRGPRLAMFLAALWSRCRRVAQSGPSWQRTDTPCWTIAPRPAHVWLVNAGSPACPVLPAFAAVTIRMARKADPPASAMDLARW